MKLKKNGATEQKVYDMVLPIAEELGFTLWDVRFEKEGAAWYLRVYIDKDGGLNIDDCEAMSRPVSDLLDETDPIPQSYYLEVGSAGLERELVREQHFTASIGTTVRVRLIRPDEAGEKEYIAPLQGFDRETITIACGAEGEALTLPLSNVAHLKWYADFS